MVDPIFVTTVTPLSSFNMTAVQGSNILDVLKKKMRQTKEEMEKYKEEGEDMQRKLQVEIMRREEVSRTRTSPSTRLADVVIQIRSWRFSLKMGLSVCLSVCLSSR